MGLKSPINKASAVFFNEGPGYLFVQSVQAGNNGQTLIVQSIEDGKLYIRKKLPANEPESNETTFYNLLPEEIAPKLVGITKYSHGDALIYSYCNGGSFAEFILKYEEVRKIFAPRAIFWEFTRQLLNILAYSHSGWSPDGKIQEGWTPIKHTDCHEGNVFIQWSPTKTSPPRFLLGDWAQARLVTTEDASQRDTGWFDVEYGEIQALYDIVIRLNDARPDKKVQDMTLNNGPIWHFRNIWDTLDEEKCLKQHQNTPGFSIAKYMAERYNPMADERLAKSPALDNNDVRWTKPETPTGFIRFGGGDETCEQSMEKWLEEAIQKGKEGKVQTLISPWEYIAIDELPFGIVAGRVPTPCNHPLCPSELLPTAMYSTAVALYRANPEIEVA
ncbi:hypothetical protein VTL71DRAFT_8371 [Oculimacula yallundae]|uniref:Protein kinase domain-containing protein n=1 Tax=Oculimacula yallundae TaxID=86028 RepID=A0ABR4CXN8_9HELO